VSVVDSLMPYLLTVGTVFQPSGKRLVVRRVIVRRLVSHVSSWTLFIYTSFEVDSDHSLSFDPLSELSVVLNITFDSVVSYRLVVIGRRTVVSRCVFSVGVVLNVILTFEVVRSWMVLNWMVLNWMVPNWMVLRIIHFKIIRSV
jgi:hypothetical protein